MMYLGTSYQSFEGSGLNNDFSGDAPVITAEIFGGQSCKVIAYCASYSVRSPFYSFN